MLAVLHLNASGIVVAANHDATEFLGACVGARCCDVVLARESDRKLICHPQCGALLAGRPSRSREIRRIRVRGRNVRLLCVTADDSPTVLIIEDEVDQSESTMLSPREASVLSLVAAGRNDAEIAAALQIGRTTVKTHLAHARAKLGAKNRAEAVALAIRAGFIA